MSNLTLMACPDCARHVRAGEAQCPFCSASLEGVAPPPRRRARGRLTRLALVAGVALAGTACGPSSSVPDDSIREQESNGDEAPPPEEDMPPPEDEGDVAPEEGDEQANEEPAPVTLYGGPSIEMLV